MTHSEKTAHEQHHDGNERDVVGKQTEDVEDSESVTQDPDINADAIQVLPGTGGPDDVGEVEEPDDYYRDGKV